MNEDIVAAARFVHPNKMFIRFSDGLTGTWSFEEIHLDMRYIDLETIGVDDGEVKMIDKCGERVVINSSMLRCSIDHEYDLKIKNATSWRERKQANEH